MRAAVIEKMNCPSIVLSNLEFFSRQASFELDDGVQSLSKKLGGGVDEGF